MKLRQALNEGKMVEDGPAVYLNSIISLETIQSIMGYSA